MQYNITTHYFSIQKLSFTIGSKCLYHLFKIFQILCFIQEPDQNRHFLPSVQMYCLIFCSGYQIILSVSSIELEIKSDEF